MRRPLEPFNCFGVRSAVSVAVADMIHQSVAVQEAFVLLQELLLRLDAYLDHI